MPEALTGRRRSPILAETFSEHAMGLMIETLSAAFERASADYASANGIERDADWFVLKMAEELGELVKAWNKLDGRGRRHGRTEELLRQDLADETADLLGHVLLFAHANGVDLGAAIERKWRFRP